VNTRPSLAVTVADRKTMLHWESQVREAKTQLSPIEIKKIQLAVRRLWNRITD